MSLMDGFWFQIGRGLAYFFFFVGLLLAFFISLLICDIRDRRIKNKRDEM